MDWTTPEGLQRLKEMAEQAGELSDWEIAPVGDSKTWVYIRAVDEAVLSDAGKFASAAREAVPQLIRALEKERK